MTATQNSSDVRQQPIYWFVLLEEAVKSGDHTAAAKAQRHLAQMGVKVSYGRPATERAEAGSC